MRRLLFWLCLTAATGAAAAPEPVCVPSLDKPTATAVDLPGHWFRAPVDGPAPAMLALHGCGGLYDGRGRLAERYVELAARVRPTLVVAFYPGCETELARGYQGVAPLLLLGEADDWTSAAPCKALAAAAMRLDGLVRDTWALAR